MSPADPSNTLSNSTLTSSALRTRQDTYERYSVPKIDFQNWVLNRIAWRGDEHVLDVGCGPGNYFTLLNSRYPNVRYRGIDLSHPMLAAHPARGHVAQADAQWLPYSDNSFDVVMANHMLFHVPDRDMAIAEFRRVLKPSGVFLSSTNSLHTMPEFQALMRRAIVLLGATTKGQVQPPPLAHHSYSLENGTRQLAHHFFAVVRYDLPTSLVFPSLDPIVTFLESTRELREPHLPPGVTWDDLMMVMREQIMALLTHFGELVVNKISGVLVASDHGGFIQDFVDRQDGKAADGHAK